MRERNITVDILKVLGIICIILAHVNPPSIIFQLRNFDVPLLVILSGILGAKTYNKDKGNIKYITKRIIRLILPVWIFLTIFFGLIFILGLCGFNVYNLNFSTILSSYALLDGIGYVWIMRVYLLCAIMLTLILYLKEKIKKSYIIVICIIMYIAYEAMYYFIGNNNIILQYIVYYIIPYGLICTFIGTDLENMENKKMLGCSIFFITIFIVLAIYLGILNNAIIQTQAYKYPPRLYYLSYAIGISILLYYLIDRKNIFNIKKRLNNKVTLFISTHSMWIYLWHIPFIYLTGKLNISNWILKYILILGGGIIFTYIQSSIIKKLKIKNKNILLILNG